MKEPGVGVRKEAAEWQDVSTKFERAVTSGSKMRQQFTALGVPERYCRTPMRSMQSSVVWDAVRQTSYPNTLQCSRVSSMLNAYVRLVLRKSWKTAKNEMQQKQESQWTQDIWGRDNSKNPKSPFILNYMLWWTKQDLVFPNLMEAVQTLNNLKLEWYLNANGGWIA